MWSRRHFLETLSSLPLLRGLAGGGAAVTGLGLAPSGARDYFRELGVRPFINAAGTYTDMTASLMVPETMRAINYASQHFVMLNELHDRVGEKIAALVRCEAAMVTCGAASALTLGTSGVLTGTDRDKIAALPNLEGMKSEVIIQKAHRFGYDRAIRTTGVRLVEVETVADLEAAVNEKTAMMMFFNNNNSQGQIRDEEFARLGKRLGVPTMNDCAADVPPVENLWKYTGMGFDLVVFSGGKGLRGPQSAGLLLGRKDLIQAARLNASPNGNAIGRGMKVNKEEMLGMYVALQTFVEKDHDKEWRDFEKRAETIRKAVAAVPGVTAEVYVPEIANHVPTVRVSWNPDEKGLTPMDVSRALREGEPSIGVRGGRRGLEVGVWMMKPGEDAIVARRLRQVLEGKSQKEKGKSTSASASASASSDA
jgi:L-seryl-tRNA(Ser) seleniumtransferase